MEHDSQNAEVSDRLSRLNEQLADMHIDSNLAPFVRTEPSQCHPFVGISFNFDFEPAHDHKTWPGPLYDPDAPLPPRRIAGIPHLERKKADRQLKRRHSAGVRSGSSQKQKQRKGQSCSIPPAARRCKTSSWPSRYQTPLPARDKPLHLLDLPGEIRNSIYRLLYVSATPLYAQFRCVLQPKKRTQEIIRRLPLEPHLATVCKQLRQESLSLFYAGNKFIFEKSTLTNHLNKPHLVSRHSPWTSYQNAQQPAADGRADTTPCDQDITQPLTLSLWQPHSLDAAQALTNLTIHFRDRLDNNIMTYDSRKTPNGNFSISLDVSSNVTSCICLEQKALAEHETSMSLLRARDKLTTTLVETAVRFARVRKGLIAEEGERQGQGRGMYEDCGGCGRKRVPMVGS